MKWYHVAAVAGGLGVVALALSGDKGEDKPSSQDKAAAPASDQKAHLEALSKETPPEQIVDKFVQEYDEMWSSMMKDLGPHLVAVSLNTEVA